MYRPSPVEQLAIQARLNFILGPREYDRLFLNFECGEIHGTSVQVFARSEYNANLDCPELSDACRHCDRKHRQTPHQISECTDLAPGAATNRRIMVANNSTTLLGNDRADRFQEPGGR
jgi:hypothetical protein